MSLEIDLTFNFMRKKTIIMGKEESKEVVSIGAKVLALDTEIGDLLGHGDTTKEDFINLLVSDQKRLPSLMKKQSSFARPLQHQSSSVTDIYDQLNSNPFQIKTELPIVQKMAMKGGISTLITSALNSLKCEYADKSLAQIWIDLLTMYNDFFAPLPGFESRYF